MLIKTAFQLFSPASDRGKLSILIFHRALSAPDSLFSEESDAVRFNLIMSWVVQQFDVLPLDEAIRLLQASKLPARAMAVTFNDDYADNYTEALLILQRHSLPATFFIATNFLDGERMWNDTIIEAVRGTKVDFLDADIPGVEAAPMRNDAEKHSFLGRLIQAIKRQLYSRRRSNALLKSAKRICQRSHAQHKTAARSAPDRHADRRTHAQSPDSGQNRRGRGRA